MMTTLQRRLHSGSGTRKRKKSRAKRYHGRERLAHNIYFRRSSQYQCITM